MKDRLLAILIWACFSWLVALVLYAALAGAGENTMPGERPIAALVGAARRARCLALGPTAACSVGQAQIVADGNIGLFQATDYGAGVPVQYIGRRATGTLAKPTAPGNSVTLMSFGGSMYDGTTFKTAPGDAGISFAVDSTGTVSATSHPSQLFEFTTPDGSTTTANCRLVDNTCNQNFVKAFAKYNNVATADTSATSMPVLNGPAPITASSTAISNTITETVFSNGTYNVAANTLTAGRTFRVQAWGQMGSTTTGPQINLRLRWGANGAPVNTDPLLIDLQGTEGISVTAKGWFATFVATCRTTGASGTVDGNGMGVIPNSVALNDNQVGTTTVDTTAAKTLALFAKFGAAVAADTITLEGFTVEWLN